MIADVVFNLPLERSFHYLVPPELEPVVRPYVRIVAPFGRRSQVGFVTGLLERSEIAALKPIKRVLDDEPVCPPDTVALARWLAEYYCCSLGEALSAIVPQALRMKPPAAQDAAATPSPEEPALALTSHQSAALAAILTSLDSPERPILLHGVTGSGKTELYLRAMERLLSEGRSAICLIPEIALTPQTVDRFTKRFGSLVAVWHSRLTASQRAAEWQRMASGQRRIVVGARSAVFAPMQRLGLIVVDEEHESTYKQEDVPRYHARDVAMARGRLARALVILGSATPAVESFHAARQGRYALLTLPERVQGRPLPTVDIIDMREAAGAARRGSLSLRLQLALEQALTKGQQALLFLNRRGFARVALCRLCGFMLLCPHCSIPVVYHASRKALICHHCSAEAELPDTCPQCHKGYLRLRGTGTERVESELSRLFPGAAVARMDSDAMKRRGSHESLYEAIKRQDIHVVVGTQMIAKGHDFPEVTLVGVVSADTALNLPDFRAGERTFDLLTQVAGRAGRGSQPGRVLVQTFHPDHYAIRAASRHDYASLFAEETAARQRLDLPPYSHLVQLTVRSRTHAKAQAASEALRQALESPCRASGIALLGPAPHRIPKLRNTYRMCLLLKAAGVPAMADVLRRTLQPGRKFDGLPVGIDVDPL